ncbi:PEP-CTERM sorting domain-containing protein [Haloferula sargassicola]|uniref:PEP-CTERM protein-sorting domain-containing protein n=1 Tax=Haloferula sargassicola TaxID=490096 RepID=A0ABP9UVP4_9BACT
MKVPPLFISLLACAPSLALAQVSLSETVTYTGSFGFGSNSSSLTEADFGTNGIFAEYVIVGGIPKFDPTLGTLTAIRVSAAYDFAAEATFEIGPVIEPLDDWHGGVDSFSFEVGIHMAKTSEPGVHYVLGETSEYFPSSYDVDTGNFSDSSSVIGFHDFSDGETDIISWADTADFVGSGNVEVLKGTIVVPAVGNFQFNNVEGLYLDTYAEISGGSVMVSYDYLPVPEPSAALMTMAGLAWVAGRRGSRA